MASKVDIETLTKTVWAEARGEGEKGMVAVAWAIRNRVETDLGKDGRPDWWGEGYEGVCKCKWQFSCWNNNDPNYKYLVGAKKIPGTEYLRAFTCANSVVNGLVPDPTGGATHYYSISSVYRPAWAKHGEFACRIGNHIFFRNVK